MKVSKPGKGSTMTIGRFGYDCHKTRVIIVMAVLHLINIMPPATGCHFCRQRRVVPCMSICRTILNKYYRYDKENHTP